MHVEAVTAGRETAANHLAYTHLYMFLVAEVVMSKVNKKYSVNAKGSLQFFEDGSIHIVDPDSGQSFSLNDLFKDFDMCDVTLSCNYVEDLGE